MTEEKIVSEVDDSLIITAYEKELFEKAVEEYRTKNKFHSTTFNETGGSTKIDLKGIDDLAFNAQVNLKKIEKINVLVRYFINKNDLLGKVYEAIESNINNEFTLDYPNYDENDKEKFDLANQIISDFNEKIGLDRLITVSIPMTYTEGNYIMYLRKNIQKKEYQVDYFPLGVAEISEYSINGDPYIVININELKTRLNKNYKKGKNNKLLFYDNLEDEVKNTMPKEVYKAFKKNEKYVKLDINNSGVMRVNNFNKLYGLSPIFKSLKPVIRLENVELSDDGNTLVRGKKIIFQKLSKELVVNNDKTNVKITWLQAQSKAHSDLMKALNQNGVSVYTGLPWVESIAYIEPNIQPTNVQTKNYYKNQIMNALGISFLSADKGTYGAAQISIGELLKVINRIAEQLEGILKKWYKGLLRDFGLDPNKYCPNIKIMNSEKLNMELSMNLAKILHNEFNASLETVYKTIGLDVKTEARKRLEEKEKGYDNIFVPRLTSYTNNGKNSNSDDVGRPSDSKDLDKQDTDRDYNQENNR